MAKSKPVLGREYFLSGAKLAVKKLETDDGIVYVRELNGRDMLAYNDHTKLLQKDNPELTPAASLELAALLVSISACDAQGKLLFTKDDVPALMEMSVSFLMTIAEEAMRVSGIPQNVIDEAKDTLKKVPNVDSTSTLPTS